MADAASFVPACRREGVLLNAFAPTRVRAVTHLDVDGAACQAAADTMVSIAEVARG